MLAICARAQSPPIGHPQCFLLVTVLVSSWFFWVLSSLPAMNTLSRTCRLLGYQPPSGHKSRPCFAQKAAAGSGGRQEPGPSATCSSAASPWTLAGQGPSELGIHHPAQLGSPFGLTRYAPSTAPVLRRTLPLTSCDRWPCTHRLSERKP